MASAPKATFEICLKGPNIAPERIPLHYLSDIFSAVQRLAAGEDVDDEDEERAVEDNAIGLLKVLRGSAVFQCVARNPKPAIKNLGRAGRFADAPERDSSAEYAYALRPLKALSTIASSFRCEIFVREISEPDHVLLSVDSDSFKRISKSVFVSGETTVLGSVQRVGGATKMRCALRVEGMNRLLICDIATPEVSRQLGAKIYQEITARGMAKWFQRSWQVFEFRIESISDAPQRNPLRQALEALREAGGKAWETVDDPEKLLQELRR